jgi:hypothetical protein
MDNCCDDAYAKCSVIHRKPFGDAVSECFLRRLKERCEGRVLSTIGERTAERLALNSGALPHEVYADLLSSVPSPSHLTVQNSTLDTIVACRSRGGNEEALAVVASSCVPIRPLSSRRVSSPSLETLWVGSLLTGGCLGVVQMQSPDPVRGIAVVASPAGCGSNAEVPTRLRFRAVNAIQAQKP